ncbi:MAG: class I SAM-dependent methyltransferase [Alphaproteobacteria bacterium]|nr:class I SAM-dependent methyltransferase [Alphaproteobacteria bacterium]
MDFFLSRPYNLARQFGRQGYFMVENKDDAKVDQPTLGERFNRVHSAHLQSSTLQRVWRNAYGDDYPEEVRPSAFYSRSTLLHLMAGLQVGPGQTVVDLGCGNGGAALWIARELGTNLIGIDLSTAGVAAATERAAELSLSNTVRFQEGDLTATGLPSASCDAAVSLDVLYAVPDKTAAIEEIARILPPGARFGFTTWEEEGYSERLKAMQIPDHRPVLDAAGFDVELYREPANWREQQQAVLEGLLASEQDLAVERDRLTADHFMALANGMLSAMPKRRYVEILARRR